MTENLPQQYVESEAPRVQGGGYSSQEVVALYSLAKLFLRNGELRKAETLINGLLQVNPSFVPALLARTYLKMFQQDLEGAVESARSALKQSPDSIEAILLLIACFLSQHDYHSAGTYLGEAGERIESAKDVSPAISRFYQAQLVRFQSR